jgi:hypothetical protein
MPWPVQHQVETVVLIEMKLRGCFSRASVYRADAVMLWWPVIFTYPFGLDQSPRPLRPVAVWLFRTNACAPSSQVMARMGSSLDLRSRMISRRPVMHKSSSGRKASTLVRLYWRMLPNSRITAHDCILIGEIRLQNGGSVFDWKGGFMQRLLPSPFGQICRLFLSFAWGVALIAGTAVGAISLCPQGPVPIPPNQVVLEAGSFSTKHV